MAYGGLGQFGALISKTNVIKANLRASSLILTFQELSSLTLAIILLNRVYHFRKLLDWIKMIKYTV